MFRLNQPCTDAFTREYTSFASSLALTLAVDVSYRHVFCQLDAKERVRSANNFRLFLTFEMYVSASFDASDENWIYWLSFHADQSQQKTPGPLRKMFWRTSLCVLVPTDFTAFFLVFKTEIHTSTKLGFASAVECTNIIDNTILSKCSKTLLNLIFTCLLVLLSLRYGMSSPLTVPYPEASTSV